MNPAKATAIRQIVDSNIKSFADGFELRYTADVDNPQGNINIKKNNCFIAELGREFIFYSAFVRSFDSSFGNVLENIGNAVAKLSFSVQGHIESYLLPQQSQHIDYLMTEYGHHTAPQIADYQDFTCVVPRDLTSYAMRHQTDHCFYNAQTDEYAIIELKSGGDMDNKKARAEKVELLKEYFLLKNSPQGKNSAIRLYLGTAYNKYGEGNDWRQERVLQFFAKEELLIGETYWNFVCDDPDGFTLVFDQYKQSADYIKQSLSQIKSLYFSGDTHD